VLCFFAEWHQYDGIMMKEPDFLSRVSNWFRNQHKSIMIQVKVATLAMLPSWDELANEHEDRRAEKLLEKVDQVCFCVKNCFVNEDITTDARPMAEVSYI